MAHRVLGKSSKAQRVPGRSMIEILNFANMVRRTFGMGNATYIDIAYFLDVVLPRFIPDFILEIVEDHELSEDEAVTYPNEMRMVVRESTYIDACKNKGRARFTLAHETAHLFIHPNIPAAYARARPISEKIKPYEDSEWQANVFAGQFLAPIDQIQGKSIEHVVQEYKISRESAKIQLDVADKKLIKRNPLA